MTTTPNELPRTEASSARVVRFDYADGTHGSNPVTTRAALAAEVTQMILNGTAENISLENLHLLKTPRTVGIEISADDPDPLGTARFLLKQAGIIPTAPARGQNSSVIHLDDSPYQAGTSRTASAVRWDVADAQTPIPLTREEVTAKVSEMILQGGPDTIVLLGLDTLPVIEKGDRPAEEGSSKAVIDAEGNVTLTYKLSDNDPDFREATVSSLRADGFEVEVIE